MSAASRSAAGESAKLTVNHAKTRAYAAEFAENSLFAGAVLLASRFDNSCCPQAAVTRARTAIRPGLATESCAHQCCELASGLRL